ncbi:MAG: SUMF1/EgtB/PvdO family nonheme iron enzyme [Treponema sp.]|nr:SUMF1/EgtB/PvdO family nonheme iron enzyme [Treponema sp.]
MSEKKPPEQEQTAKKPSREILPEDEVRLKSFRGIKPGAYLACLYGFILLLVLFFILLYPGLSKPGSMVIVNSEPRGAAVYVDGAYKDAAPCRIFVPKGKRVIELDLPGFVSRQIERDISGRLFASIFFPRTVEISEKLETSDAAKAFTDYAAEFAAWSFAGEPSAAYQIPMSLSDGAYRLGNSVSDSEKMKSMEDTVTASTRYAVTRAGLRDLVRAKTLLDNHGLSPSPLSLLGSTQDALDFLDKNPEAALWLASLLSGDAKSLVSGSSWYGKAANGIDSSTNAVDSSASSNGSSASSSSASPSSVNAPNNAGAVIEAGKLKFTMIKGDRLSSGTNFPAGTTVDSFYISETVISAEAWELFLEQEPKWKPENTESLIQEGLVKEEYLAKNDSPNAPNEGIPGISWYAAEAFCKWLGASLPSQFSSWEVRLPTEAEWELAAKTGLVKTGDYWEWCEDAYVPLSFLSVPAAAAIVSPEKSVRGGSWVNPRGSVNSETRGSLPPAFCSPFVSARPVIALKGDPR